MTEHAVDEAQQEDTTGLDAAQVSHGHASQTQSSQETPGSAQQSHCTSQTPQAHPDPATAEAFWGARNKAAIATIAININA